VKVNIPVPIHSVISAGLFMLSFGEQGRSIFFKHLPFFRLCSVRRYEHHSMSIVKIEFSHKLVIMI